jgi:hypothetical protein
VVLSKCLKLRSSHIDAVGHHVAEMSHLVKSTHNVMQDVDPTTSVPMWMTVTLLVDHLVPCGLSNETRGPRESQRIRCIQGIIANERVRLPCLRHLRVDAQELIGRRIVVTVDYLSC